MADAAISVLADIQKQAGLHAVAYTDLHNYIFECLAYYVAVTSASKHCSLLKINIQPFHGKLIISLIYC
jgi:hypothetical protein